MAKDGRIYAGLAIALTAIGCGGKPAPTYPDYAPATSLVAISRDNGFSLYVQAADDVEARGHALLTRVAFTAQDKQALYTATEGAIKLLDKGTAMTVTFAFTPHKPFVASPHQVGWGLIGHSLDRHIEDAAQAGQYDVAIGYVLLATKFGFDLAGGGATDASLGLTIVNNARKAFVEYIPQLSAAQLEKLSTGLQNSLRSKPDFSRMVANEKLNMMEGVQYVQNAYRSDSYDELIHKLQSDIRDAVKYLRQEVKPKDEKERPKYFEGFAHEADAEAKWETEMAVLPAMKRNMAKGPDLQGERPWKRFAKHFFQSGRSILEINDATIARTRLFALQAELTKAIKTDQKAPSSLTSFSPDLILDPYNGGTFIYRAQGMNFRIYSVGDNFRDDGGHAGDLLLETGP
jgi:hypothetical protein